MKKHKFTILLIGSIIVFLYGCNDDSSELDIEPIEMSIEFNLPNNEILHESKEVLFLNLVTPVFQSPESRIADYIKFYSFQLENEFSESFNIQLHSVVDIFEETPDWDSLFLANVMKNEAIYITEQLSFRGFGITTELRMIDDTKWYSSGLDNISQNGSEIDIYEVIELDTATYIKVKFNCSLFNELGESVIVESGNATLRLN